MRVSNRWGVRAGFGVILLSLVSSLYVSYRSLQELDAGGHLGGKDHEAILEIERLLLALTDAESGPRGYLLTGKESYLEPYQQALPQIEQHFRRLTVLTADHPVQRHRLEELREVVAEKLQLMKELIDLRRDKGFEAALQVFQTDRGQQSMELARRMLMEMREDEEYRRVFQTFIQSSLGVISLTILLICVLILWRKDAPPVGASGPGRS